jgi:hypothetical protein
VASVFGWWCLGCLRCSSRVFFVLFVICCFVVFFFFFCFCLVVGFFVLFFCLCGFCVVFFCFVFFVLLLVGFVWVVLLFVVVFWVGFCSPHHLTPPVLTFCFFRFPPLSLFPSRLFPDLILLLVWLFQIGSQCLRLAVLCVS